MAELDYVIVSTGYNNKFSCRRSINGVIDESYDNSFNMQPDNDDPYNYGKDIEDYPTIADLLITPIEISKNKVNICTGAMNYIALIKTIKKKSCLNDVAFDITIDDNMIQENGIGYFTVDEDGNEAAYVLDIDTINRRTIANWIGNTAINVGWWILNFGDNTQDPSLEKLYSSTYKLRDFNSSEYIGDWQIIDHDSRTVGNVLVNGFSDLNTWNPFKYENMIEKNDRYRLCFSHPSYNNNSALQLVGNNQVTFRLKEGEQTPTEIKSLLYDTFATIDGELLFISTGNLCDVDFFHNPCVGILIRNTKLTSIYDEYYKKLQTSSININKDRSITFEKDDDNYKVVYPLFNLDDDIETFIVERINNSISGKIVTSTLNNLGIINAINNANGKINVIISEGLPENNNEYNQSYYKEYNRIQTSLYSKINYLGKNFVKRIGIRTEPVCHIAMFHERTDDGNKWISIIGSYRYTPYRQYNQSVLVIEEYGEHGIYDFLTAQYNNLLGGTL